MFRTICTRGIFNTINRKVFQSQQRNFDFYEPTYLEVNIRYDTLCKRFQFLGHLFQALKPKQPIYELVNVQIKGYDFPVLEKYQKFLNHMAESLSLEVEDG